MFYSLNKSSFSSYVFAIVYSLGFSIYIYIFIKKNVKAIISFFVVLGIFLLSISADQDIWNIAFNTTWAFSNFTIFFGLIFPLFLLSYFRLNLNYLMELFYKYSLLAVPLYISSFALNIFFLGINVHEYMTFAYNGLTAVFVLIHYGRVNHKPLPIVLGIAGSIVTMAGGSRGAFGTLILFCVIYFLFYSNKILDRKFWIAIFSSAAAIVLIYANLKSILSFVGQILASYGYNSRILDFIGGEFYGETLFQSSGREEIQNALYKHFELWGHGVYSDRVIAGVYSHNWILEFIMHYGLLLGSILIVIIIYRVVTAFWYARKKYDLNAYFFSTVALTMIFGKYLLSSSYLSSNEFCLFVGLASYIYSIKLKQSTKNVI
jgi:hypothetical protein